MLTNCPAPTQRYSKTKTVVVSTTTTTTTTYTYTPTASPTKQSAKATSASAQRATPSTQMRTTAGHSKNGQGTKSTGPHSSIIIHSSPPDLGLVLPAMAPTHMPPHAAGRRPISPAGPFLPPKTSTPRPGQPALLPPCTPPQVPLQMPPTFTRRYNRIIDPGKLLGPHAGKNGYHAIVCGQEVGVFCAG